MSRCVQRVESTVEKSQEVSSNTGRGWLREGRDSVKAAVLDTIVRADLSHKGDIPSEVRRR